MLTPFDDNLQLLKHQEPAAQISPEGCNLYWSSLNVTGPERKKTGTFLQRWRERGGPRRVKEILHNVSGMAESGKLLAIMGSSGAGKTTLLNVLTSRNLNNLDVQGSILVDGKRANKWKIREMSAFVQQHDMFVGTMTAREHLQFMATLRMGDHYSHHERLLRVEQVLTQMGLQQCADTVIGIPNELKGLSCGEKKRLSFAAEILTCPKILFCDEPTSGLDAFMAGHVVQALRSLADNGMTVIITIHQPSSQVYSLFHNVCLMACGRVIYLGPGDKAVPLFEKCGYPCPAYFNPADHLIRTLAVIDSDRATSMKTISKIRHGFLATDLGQSVMAIGNANKLRASSYATSDSSEKTKTFFNQDYNASFWTQFEALSWRAYLTVIRDPNLLSVRLFQIIITALVTGMVFFQTPITPETIVSVNGIMFNHIRNMNFMLQFPNVPVITAELPIVLRENANGVYRTSAYFLAKNIAELPQYIILPIIYNTIVYWMAGLYPSFMNFCFACLVTILITNVAISISYAVATIFANTDVAMTVLPIFVVPIMAFGGFFITFDAIPPYFTWLSSLSYFKYGYEALAINEWESVWIIPECFAKNATAFALNGCPKNGYEVLESIDFSASNKLFDIAILFIMFLVIRIIAYFAILIRSYTNN
uniref:ABC transporter domain-containing protein n=1 Tax=Caenorhabditis japonica TaxID=281687 RepID=A0A8R1HZY2_CAEJA